MGMKGDYQTEKSLIDRVSPLITMGPWKLLYENDDVYVFIVFSKHTDNPTRHYNNGYRSEEDLLVIRLSERFKITTPAKVKTGTGKVSSD